MWMCEHSVFPLFFFLKKICKFCSFAIFHVHTNIFFSLDAYSEQFGTTYIASVSVGSISKSVHTLQYFKPQPHDFLQKVKSILWVIRMSFLKLCHLNL